MKKATDFIQEYSKLHDQEILTDDEYNYLKKHFLELGDTTFEEDGDGSILDASLQETAKARKNEAKQSLYKTISIAIIGVIIGVIAMGFSSCVSFLFNAGSSGPEYETTYEDDNGNGKLDKGEWNYTTDEDGNVVDVDDDLNNFE